MSKEENALQGENRELKARVSALEKDGIQASKDLNAARKKADKIEGLKEQVSVLEDEVKHLEKQNDRLNAEISSLRANESKVDQQLSDLEALKRLLRG